LANDVMGALEAGTEYIIVERQQMNVLLEGADLQIFLLKQLLQKLGKRSELPVKERDA